MIPAGTWAEEAVEGLDESTIRIDLRRDGDDTARTADLVAALELEPDLV